MRLVLLRDLHFIFILADAVLTFKFQGDTVWIQAQMKLSPFHYKTNGLTS